MLLVPRPINWVCQVIPKNQHLELFEISGFKFYLAYIFKAVENIGFIFGIGLL